MAKKQATQKQTPPLTPLREPIVLKEPLRIVAVDQDTKTVTVHGPVPEEVAALREEERKRLDLVGRLQTYNESLLVTIEDHFGNESVHYAAAQQRDADRLDALIRFLPTNVPAEVRYALLAMRSLSFINQALIEFKNLTPLLKFVLCNAIDFGQLLQLHHDQIEHGSSAATGRRNTRSREVAIQAKQQITDSRVEQAKAEYIRRMQARGTMSETSVLKSMASVTHRGHDRNGRPVDVRTYGSYSQLIRDRDAGEWRELLTSPK